MALPGVEFIVARISNLDLLRAASWGTLGSALLLLGGGVGGALGAVGASSHLWGDDAFLAGFALSCLLGAVGAYVLVGAFFGGIGPIKFPLPRMKFEIEASQDEHQIHQAVSHLVGPRADGGEPGEPPPGGGRGGAGGAGHVGGGAGGAGGPGSGGGGGQGGGVVLPVTQADGTVELRRFEGGRGGRGGGRAGGEGGGT